MAVAKRRKKARVGCSGRERNRAHDRGLKTFAAYQRRCGSAVPTSSRRKVVRRAKKKTELRRGKQNFSGQTKTARGAGWGVHAEYNDCSKSRVMDNKIIEAASNVFPKKGMSRINPDYVDTGCMLAKGKKSIRDVELDFFKFTQAEAGKVAKAVKRIKGVRTRVFRNGV